MELQQEIFLVLPVDFPRVVEVWETSVRATHDFLSEEDIHFFKPLVHHEIAGDIQLACMRDREGRVVGFIGVSGQKIEMLFVDPAWRGRGVGRRLLEYAVLVHRAEWVDVNEQNHQAIGFYRRMGFEIVGRSEIDSLKKPFPVLHLRLPISRLEQSTADI